MNRSEKINTLSDYGNIMISTADQAKLRGTGRWDPPPFYYQSMDRGNADKRSWEMYQSSVMNDPKERGEYHNLAGVNVGFNSTTEYQIKQADKEKMSQEFISRGGLEYKGLNNDLFYESKNVNSIYDYQNTGGSDLYIGGQINSWESKEYKGAENHYTEFALKALMQGGMMPTPLALFFFSTENIDYLQNRIVDLVKKINGTDIYKQSIDDLIIIMINKLQYAYTGWLANEKNPEKVENRGEKPCSLEYRLTLLNKNVLQEVVKQVLGGIKMYQEYYKDISSLPMPLSLPEYTSMHGSRVLSENIGFNTSLNESIWNTSYNERYNII